MVQNVLCNLSQAVNYLKNKGVYVKKYSSSGGVLQRTLTESAHSRLFSVNARSEVMFRLKAAHLKVTSG